MLLLPPSENEGTSVPADLKAGSAAQEERALELSAEASVLFESVRALVIPALMASVKEADARLVYDRVAIITATMAALMGGVWGVLENDDRFSTMFWDISTQHSQATRDGIRAELRARGLR